MRASRTTLRKPLVHDRAAAKSSAQLKPETKTIQKQSYSRILSMQAVRFYFCSRFGDIKLFDANSGNPHRGTAERSGFDVGVGGVGHSHFTGVGRLEPSVFGIMPSAWILVFMLRRLSANELAVSAGPAVREGVLVNNLWLRFRSALAKALPESGEVFDSILNSLVWLGLATGHGARSTPSNVYVGNFSI